MLNSINRINNVVVRICEVLCTILLLGITLLAFINVVTRYWLVYSIPWIDEVTRYMMIWMTFIAAGLATNKSEHVEIDLLPNLLKDKFKHFDYTILIDIVIIISMAIFMKFAFGLIANGKATGRVTPVLMIPMHYMYISTVVGAVLCIWFSVKNIIFKCARLLGKKEEVAE